jgi:fused signal recognition particle receptor
MTRWLPPARNADVVIVDTAGRLHNKLNLMAELDKMKRTATKSYSRRAARSFTGDGRDDGPERAFPGARIHGHGGVTGIVLTKLDGTAKGGIVVAITRELGLPVQYVGTGESIEDLVPFDAETFVSSCSINQ